MVEWMGDLADAWLPICVALILTLGFSFLFMFLINRFTAFVIWGGIIMTVIIGIAIGIAFFIVASSYEGWAKRGLRILSVFVLCLVGLFCLVICCYWYQLRIAVSILQCSANHVNSTKRVILVPVVIMCIVICFYIWWTTSAIFLWAVGEIKSNGFQTKEVEWNNTTRVFWFYHFIGLLWMNATFIAIAQFIIIVGAATWYFSHNSDKEGSAELVKGFKWSFRYHFGTLAFGAAVLAFVWLVRRTTDWFRKRMRKQSTNDAMGKCMYCMLATCGYYVRCLDRFISFIT